MKKHNSMRGEFAYALYNKMAEDQDIFVLVGDLGYGMFDDIKKDYSDRFLNVGASEQSMMDIAVGLALEGKKPFVYSITPFLIYRPFETLRTYIDHEKIPVRMVASGRYSDYKHDGFSHYAGDDYLFLSHLKNIKKQWPTDKTDMEEIVNEMVELDVPYYLNLRR